MIQISLPVLFRMVTEIIYVYIRYYNLAAALRTSLRV
jgi:hypothetical protein